MAEFSYFDQFNDVEIDLTDLLNKICAENNIPKNSYTFSNNQPVVTNIKNLFSKYELIFEFRDNIELIITYEVKDGESLEEVAYKNYEERDFWWVVAIFNDVKSVWTDWPLTQEQLVTMATILYEEEAKFSFDGYVDFLHEKNEVKRKIILPKVQTLKDIIWKYREAILRDAQ